MELIIKINSSDPLSRKTIKICLISATICSIHFEEGCFEVPLKQRLLNYSPKSIRNIKADAVPTLNLPGGLSDCLKRKSEERSLRMAKRKHKEEVKEIMKSSTSTSTNTLEISDTEIMANVCELTTVIEKSTQTSANYE